MTTTDISPSQRTIPALLECRSTSFPERVLVRWPDRCWTVGEARGIAAGSAGTLHEAGIKAGDRVALYCSNRPEFLEVFLGCLWLGAIVVPINTAARGAQLGHILSNSGARLLVIEAESLTSLDAVDPQGLSLEKIWEIDASGRDIWSGRPISSLPRPSQPVESGKPGPGDLAAILYTSGTTGLSKGVCCSHAHLFWWGQNSIWLLELTADDVLCTTLPLFHVNALSCFIQALLSGASVRYEPRFSASAFWRTLAECGATVTYLLGAMVPILLSRAPTPEERGHRVRLALAPGVPEQFHAPFFERTGMELLDGYGSTESNFVVGSTVARKRPGLMGFAFSGFQVKVVDDEDCEVADGTPGELIVRADQPFAMASGYWGMPDKTVEAWRNLWFHSGDRVIREADGYFRFVDRLKDAIRRRGENISSFEVEQVLLSHPSIASAAVFPVKSDMAEDEVMAAVVLRPDCALDGPELMQFCEPLLAYFAIPRYVDFLAELPLTENGKVQKYRLRERGITAATWDREAAGYRIKRR